MAEITGTSDVSPALALVRKLNGFLPLTEDEIAALRNLGDERQPFREGDDLIAAGDRYSYVYLLESGWAIRHKLTVGGDRVITNFLLPGDFICFDAPIFEASDHSVTAITDLVAARIEPDAVIRLASDRPKVALALAWCAAKEESLIEEHLLNSAKRSARARMAHLLIELWRRLEIVHLTEDGNFPLPVTQHELADSLGLSLWYVNRVLQGMRRSGLIELSVRLERHVTIVDKQALMREAGFDDEFLHFTEVPARTLRAVERSTNS